MSSTRKRLESTDRIRNLNDAFRKVLVGGKVLLTAGVNGLDDAARAAVIVKVRDFNTFVEDNDPYGEHDFGAFDQDGVKIFWKIDCYAPDMEHGSSDPADPAVTVRVLTVMLADEY